MLFVVRSNDSFNFPLGLIKYTVIVVINQYSVLSDNEMESSSIL